MKALIVEDLKPAQKMLEKLISKYAECEFANDGMEGLSAFIGAHKNQQPYDVIFLDIMLPRLNGLELLKKSEALIRVKTVLKLL